MSLPIRLNAYLGDLYNKFDISCISPDPLEFVHTSGNPREQEVIGLIASSFAYGKVERIITSIDKILSAMNNKPFEFIKSFDPVKDGKRFEGFTHRFNTGHDVACLIHIIQHAINKYGSLKNLFLSGYREKDKNIKEGLVKFVKNLLNTDIINYYGKKTTGIRYLLPSPVNGSACKRLNMFLRWMVRRGDSLDCGIWEEVSPSKLIIPLDTHTARISHYIGLTDKRNINWKMAEEITKNLKLLDPDDPVKYDFALSRLGILKLCSKKIDKKKCRACLLKKICIHYGI